MNEALDQPILIKRTVPVKMFARKPNKKHSSKTEKAPSSSKRKREVETIEEPQSKIVKTQPSADFNDFSKKLDELVGQSQHLSFEDRQRATSLILSKFGLSVPFIFATNNDPYGLYQDQDPSNAQYHQI